MTKRKRFERAKRAIEQEVGTTHNELSPASRAVCFVSPRPWGSASLHPRLYAIAALRGLNSRSPLQPSLAGLPFCIAYRFIRQHYLSSINLSQNNIQRPNNRNHVRDQMSEAKFLKRLQVHEARRAHAHPPGLLRAVGNQIAANLAFRSFDRMIVIANGRLD